MKTSMRATGPMHLLGAFYAAMAGLALYGQSDGLMTWLGVDRVWALAVAVAVELLAAVLFAFADWRRTHHGERAVAARLLSVVVALGVAAMNYYGHHGVGDTAVYTGASLAGYSVWVLHTEARRRDALRAANRLPAQPPVYGLALWLRTPGLVARARQLAIADPTLGVHDSIVAAETEAATAVRRRATVAALRVLVAQDLDPVTARVTLASCDLDQVAAGIADGIDYDRLTERIVANIAPVWLGKPAELPPVESRRRKAIEASPSGDVPEEGSQVVSRRASDTKQARRPIEVTRAMAREKLAEPGMTRAAAAKFLRITPRRLRAILNEPTGEHPVVTVPDSIGIRSAWVERANGHDILADPLPV